VRRCRRFKLGKHSHAASHEVVQAGGGRWVASEASDAYIHIKPTAFSALGTRPGGKGGRACPHCPGISEIDLFQPSSTFNASIPDRAFDLVCPSSHDFIMPSVYSLKVKGVLRGILCIAEAPTLSLRETCQNSRP